MRSRLFAFLLLLALAPLGARAIDGSAVVSGGGTVSFVGASSTNWVKNASGDPALILVYDNPEEESPSFSFDGLTSARILAVGGGGGGGGGYKGGFSGNYGGGGGGGAGAFIEVTNLYGAATYEVAVGAGGAGGAKGNTATTDCTGKDGGETTIMTNGVAMLTASGGGGGGAQTVGNAGGSGGGGSMKNSGAAVNAGGLPINILYGHAGGSGNVGMYGGGGGGAGKAGADASSLNPVGGDGRPSDIAVDAGTAEDQIPWYAGGGGGSHSDKKNTTPTARIAGGKGGGGQGGVGKGSGTAAMGPTAGEDGTGGGGGGCDATTTGSGADGGSGVVIVRIEGAGLPSKPKDAQYLFDGNVHYAVTPSPFIEIVDGQNAATESGLYVVTAKPIEGLTWDDDDTADPVTVTMVIYDGEEEVTGAPVKFFGASNVTRVKDEAGNENLLLEFREKGGYILPGASSARILAVGGGGGGGGGYKGGFSGNYGGGGGGGAGAFIEVTNLYGAATYEVVVGAGGAGGAKGNTTSTDCTGKDGGDTTITTNGIALITAYGGGGGGAQTVGNQGGSGGGGSMKNSGAVVNAGGLPINTLYGHAGGSGDIGMYGGGGGGAGGVGGDASSLNPTGGVGRASDIAVDFGTAEEDILWYAGGGGGSHSDKLITAPTARIVGGKGGGGAGGVGKGSGTAAMGPTAGEDGTGGGGGGCDATTTGTGAAGGSGIVYIRISSAMKGEFKKPDPYVEYTYDREEHVAIQPFAFYEISDENVRTNAGTYHATATLKPGVPSWPDGTTDPATTEMKILKRPVTIANLHVDDWEYRAEKTPEPTCVVKPSWAEVRYEWKVKVEGEGEQWKDWSSGKPTKVGEYELRALVKDEENLELAEPPVTTFKITKIAVTISDLRMRNWMVGTPPERTPEPTCTVTPAWASEYVVYTYAADKAGPWTGEKPTELGTWWVKAEPGDPDSFTGEPAYASFNIVNGLGDIFTDYVEITVSGYTGTDPDELLNYPCKVSLSELDPLGFLYERAGGNGNDLAFTKEDGRDILPYAVESWDTNDTSVVWVRLDKVTREPQTIRLYWHVYEGKTVPDHHPELVWNYWTKEEAEAVEGKPSLAVSSPVSRDGYLINYWVKEPILSKTFWDVSDEEKGYIVQDAELAFDNERVRRTFTNIVAGVGYDEMPTDIVGSFRIVYRLDDPGEAYDQSTIETHVDYAVSGITPWDDLKGNAKSLTLSGRVMLANDDVVDEKHAVSDQSYWQTRFVDIGGGVILTNDVFWTHEGETKYKASWGNDNLLTNCTHRLKYIGDDGKTNVLWRFENIRIGNNAKGETRRDGYYYLPNSTSGLGISSYANYYSGQGTFAESGNIVMRNTCDEADPSTWAVVYSPCYTNGIGTIYFDAVNAQQDYLVNRPYRIVVEVATETVDHLPPTDENAAGEDDYGTPTDLGKIRKENWKPCEMLPLLHSGEGSAFVPQTKTKDFNLAINKLSDFGKDDNFYRICVKVNESKPCRFRIRRVSAVPTADVEPDQGEYLLLDNILVSYPNMTAKMEPYGEYDETRAGKQILGQELATTVPFPAAGEGGVFARGKATTFVNEFAPIDPKGLILWSQFYYRWRYLDQAFEPEDESWKVVELWPADGMVAREPLELPNDEGDIEFWYRTFLNAPSYDYFDYSGAALKLNGTDGKPLYIDANPSVTNVQYRAPSDPALPSAGTNWFFRLRAGRSACEGVRLLTRTKDTDAVTTNEMEVVGDGLWRGCVPTPEATAGLEYRFEAVNRQASGATKPVKNVVYWNMKETVDKLPGDADYEESETAPRWSEVPCDAKTGYLMFKLDETKSSVYVAHADWQDFNLWASAAREDGKFVGNVVDTNTTSYVAQQIPINWAMVTPSVATNGAWTEDFDAGGQVPRDRYPRNVPFRSARTEHGWNAENGMWTYGEYATETADITKAYDDKTALQLQGCGLGLVEMSSTVNVPTGIDQVRFTARVAQFNTFENFTYYNGIIGGGMPTDLSDGTFATTALMSESGFASFNGDASLSLVANYHPAYGCYELRVSLGGDRTALKLELYRWTATGGAWKSTLLSQTGKGVTFGTTSKYLVRNWEGKKGKAGGLFISVQKTANGVNVKGGSYNGDIDQGKAANMFITGASGFSTVTYYDKSSEALNLTQGSFGLLSRNCPGFFENPVYITKSLAGTPKDTDANKLLSSTSEKPTASTSTTLLVNDGDYKKWIVKPGRMERLAQTTAHLGQRGFQAIQSVSQRVVVEWREHNAGGEWQGLAETNTVSGFIDKTFVNTVRSTTKSDVRLQVLGTIDDPRNDVVLNRIELTQWAGQTTPEFADESKWGLPDWFVYTSAWVNEYVEGDHTNRTVSLQPTRAASVADPVSLRTPLMRGFGLLHFAWRNADPDVKLLVQIAAGATRNNLFGLTKASPDHTGTGANEWETLETLTFADLGGESGERTIHVNRRYPASGALRLVIARDTVAAAIAQPKPRDYPDYGKIEITDLYVWDLPEWDDHSWRGWNFRTEGWYGLTPSDWANLADGGTTHGMSGLLNNTLDPSTLADTSEKTQYEKNPPYVQSPTFGTNCIGAVDFRARLYGVNDLRDHGYPAVVTVYGAKDFDILTGEPKNWEQVTDGDFAISNGFYRTFSKRFKPNEKYVAIRFAVKGVRGVESMDEPVYDPPLRVALDDICIYERPNIAVTFRKFHVRPFRNAESMKGVEKVRDIDSVNEQPLAGEAFGFQAEVQVDSDEVLIDDPAHPITVELSYYPSAEPWGYRNWKDAPGATKDVQLEKAVGETLIFRSVGSKAESMCPPQLLKDGEGYRIVQYHLTVKYYDTTLAEGENELSPDNWTMPSWNTGFPDPNAAEGASFSGFTLLESIAPKRAWINEISFAEKDKDSSAADQWVEIAVPSGIDMTGWKLLLYDPEADRESGGDNQAGLVGSLMTFGKGCPAKKAESGDPSHYDFYLVKGPKTKTLAKADATWPKLTKGSVSDGYLNYNYPYGFELVRPTGVVEHRVVAQGYNYYKQAGKWYWPDYEGTNLVKKLNEKFGVDDWVWGEEDHYLSPGATLGVVSNQGGAHEDWYSPMGRTPGGINEGQYIDPNWFVYPNGGYFWINAIVQGPNMKQIIGGETNLVGSLTVQEGGTTSIVYEVDRWYEMGPWAVTPNERATMSGATVGANKKLYYTLTLANVSNQLSVTASADVDGRLRALGVDDENPYRNAIMKWLAEGDFAGDEIILPHYRGAKGELDIELGINDLYWLDLDPTKGGWEIWGGMGEKGDTENLGKTIEPVERYNPDGSGRAHTNILTTCWLMITNANDAAVAAYPPYRLQGLANEQSDTFGGVWTSETFKIVMMMATEDWTLKSQWHTMRQFVFGPGSFRGADDSQAPFAARIEITDPFSRQSPAWEWDWWKYAGRGLSPFTSYRLNGEISPAGVSTLKKDDTFEDSW